MSHALVDLDGTLLDKPSTEARFIRCLLRHGMLGPRQGLAAAWFFARRWPRYGRDVARKNKAYLAGLEVARVAAAAERFVEREVLPALRGAVIERLRRHAEGGGEIVLITGAPEFIARPVARQLRAGACYATRCEQAGGRYTGGAPRQHPYGEQKLALAQRWCRARGVTLAGCTGYADAHHDAVLLAAVGRAVAVTPDRHLARLAARKGWEVIEDTGERGRGGQRGVSVPHWPQT